MDIESLWGPPSVMAAIIGSIVMFFVKRTVQANDKMNKEREDQIDGLITITNDLRVSVEVIRVKLENVSKAIDRVNGNGCNLYKQDRVYDKRKEQ